MASHGEEKIQDGENKKDEDPQNRSANGGSIGVGIVGNGRCESLGMKAEA